MSKLTRAQIEQEIHNLTEDALEIERKVQRLRRQLNDSAAIRNRTATQETT